MDIGGGPLPPLLGAPGQHHEKDDLSPEKYYMPWEPLYLETGILEPEMLIPCEISSKVASSMLLWLHREMLNGRVIFILTVPRYFDTSFPSYNTLCLILAKGKNWGISLLINWWGFSLPAPQDSPTVKVNFITSKCPLLMIKTSTFERIHKLCTF